MNRMFSELLADMREALSGLEIKIFDEILSKDMVEVVRCEDCIHRYVTGDVTRYYVCDFMDAQYEDDGYCHHGEREEE